MMEELQQRPLSGADPQLSQQQPAAAKAVRGALPRLLYLLLAWLSLTLGVIGIVVPGLPTTPFVLLAAWAAARGSQRLHQWLLAHRLFGPMVRDWQASGAVSRRAKWAATWAMAVCALIFFLTAPKLWMAALGSSIMAVVALWLWRRPEPQT